MNNDGAPTPKHMAHANSIQIDLLKIRIYFFSLHFHFSECFSTSMNNACVVFVDIALGWWCWCCCLRLHWFILIWYGSTQPKNLDAWYYTCKIPSRLLHFVYFSKHLQFALDRCVEFMVLFFPFHCIKMWLYVHIHWIWWR